ncbi:hypothetical protein C8R43DRAFT_1136440 [Mycena crocata]|nr:hypothetical protein C8R43DRAFT_1136440 [Mycena crocata]
MDSLTRRVGPQLEPEPRSARTFDLARDPSACVISIDSTLTKRELSGHANKWLPDEKLRLAHIDTLNNVKLAVEQRIIQAQAQLDSSRDRYDLDDEDLAFEVEMRPSEEFIVWEEELEVLKEECRQIICCIEYSRKFCEAYKPEEGKEEPPREPISIADLIHLEKMWRDADVE